MKKKLFFACTLILCASMFAAKAKAEEELAPGFDACMEKAQSTADNLDCTGKAYTYWDKILNANFKKAQAACGDAPDVQKCRANLLKAQRLWIQYKEAMAQVVDDLDGGGTLARVNASYFMAKETKKQAQLLDTGE